MSTSPVGARIRTVSRSQSGGGAEAPRSSLGRGGARLALAETFAGSPAGRDAAPRPGCGARLAWSMPSKAGKTGVRRGPRRCSHGAEWLPRAPLSISPARNSEGPSPRWQTERRGARRPPPLSECVGDRIVSSATQTPTLYIPRSPRRPPGLRPSEHRVYAPRAGAVWGHLRGADNASPARHTDARLGTPSQRGFRETGLEGLGHESDSMAPQSVAGERGENCGMLTNRKCVVGQPGPRRLLAALSLPTLPRPRGAPVGGARYGTATS